ncbi:uncharacterized protein FFUJ_06430 [Fusarium fujikuroi IMI 58289]|uniref:Uncharacterized protein n=1 Tax=Gibberella fujikuroi (strain CBS 195.34 / IMI 58289 / NRRL A-6831) TaxID=1279085 RepID=S0E7G9_GIBF5|nr:uncharacterized protein FFUJ_06430 [Fusarium fujikuroi IMI 58289]CCT70811.1 uncharacterized protein FFUJ_06430 [Fusarium fujikuroi IMI 58289]
MPQLFESNTDQENLFTFDQTPTYLFRPHVPRSKGDTSVARVTAPAFLGGTAYYRDGLLCSQDILQLPTEKVTSRLKDPTLALQLISKQLVDGGLFTVICPALNKPNNWADWAISVCELRVGIRESHIVDQKQIRSAIFVAKDCVGDRFLVPFALMLLGVRSRQSDNSAIANVFQSLFTDEELNFRGVKYDQYSGRMEELRRFRELMEAVEKQNDENPLAETTRLMEGLGLSTNGLPIKKSIYVGPFSDE